MPAPEMPNSSRKLRPRLLDNLMWYISDLDDVFCVQTQLIYLFLSHREISHCFQRMQWFISLTDKFEKKKIEKKILAAAFCICLATTIFYYFSEKKIPCSHMAESANKNKGNKRNHWIYLMKIFHKALLLCCPSQIVI